MTDVSTKTVIAAVARVCADAVEGHIFSAGVDVVTASQPLVVPISDDFTQTGLPAVTCALAPWESAPQPGNERRRMQVLGAVWRARVPMDVNVAALYDDLDALVDAFAVHSKAYLHEQNLQSAIFSRGPGIQERSIGDAEAPRMFLTLPFTVEVVVSRPVVRLPA